MRFNDCFEFRKTQKLCFYKSGYTFSRTVNIVVKGHRKTISFASNMSDQGPQSNLPLLPGYSFSTTLGKEKFYKVNSIHRFQNLIFESSLITLTSVTATLCGLATRNLASAASQSTLVSFRLLNPVATRNAFLNII